MNITSETVIGQLVAADYRAASIFKQNQIDFCCQGGRTIGQACEQKKIDSSELIEQLESAMVEKSESTPNFDSWPIDLLADYIEKTHHRYVRKRLPEIKPFLSKVARVHGERHPELLEIENLFDGAMVELSEHMMKEENILFPYVKEMVSSDDQDLNSKKPHFGSIENPITMMMQEHDVEGQRFRRISELTNNYQPPQDACNTYRVAFAMLKEFEDDLHSHIHLENNILFPKAISLEQRN